MRWKYTRNGHDWTERYPLIIESAQRIDCRSALIDGEICVQNEHGVTDFAALPAAIRNDPGSLIFFAFDLLHLDGDDLRSQPLEERRAKLRWMLDGNDARLHISDEYSGNGKAFFELVDRMGLEGVVSKKKGSRYVSGNARTWLKTKCWNVSEFEVIGVERDKTGIPCALLADEAGYRGMAFIALPAALRNAFWRYVGDRSVEKPVFPSLRKKGTTWLTPGMRASVRYLKGSDKLRHATVQTIAIGKD